MMQLQRKRVAIFLMFVTIHVAKSSSQISRNELLGRCSRKTISQRYPHCMHSGDGDPVLWCDQSNYTRIQAPHELSNGHITADEGMKKKILFINDSCLLGIEKGDLSGYKFLTEIRASENYIRRLYKYAFSQNQQLQRIYLSSNLIIEIDDDSFEGLSELILLDLSDNKINEMRDKTFKHLRSLEELSLARNNIADLNSRRQRLFRYLKNLKKLDLSGNKIISIDNALNGLAKLEHLFLDENRLRSIRSEEFDGLVSLKTLTATQNEIYEWPEASGGSYQLFQQLRVLNLSENELKYFTQRHLASLTELSVLSLGNNSLSTIEENLFSSNLKLKFLNLSVNYIKEIPANTFKSLRELQTLLLENNRLEILQKEWFLHLSKQETPTVNVQGFHWDCDCAHIKFTNFLVFLQELKTSEDQWNRTLWSQLQRTKCSKPKSSENKILDDLDHVLCRELPPTPFTTTSKTSTTTTASTTTTVATTTTTTQITATRARETPLARNSYKSSSVAPDVGSFHIAIIVSMGSIIVIISAIAVIACKLKTPPWTKAKRQSKRRRNESSQNCMDSESAIPNGTTPTEIPSSASIVSDNVFRATIDRTIALLPPEPNHHDTRPRAIRDSRSDENTYVAMSSTRNPDTPRSAQQYFQLQHSHQPPDSQQTGRVQEQYFTPVTIPKHVPPTGDNYSSITVPKQPYSNSGNSPLQEVTGHRILENDMPGLKAAIPRRPSADSFQSCKDLPSLQLESVQFYSVNVPSIGYRESGDGAEEHAQL